MIFHMLQQVFVGPLSRRKEYWNDGGTGFSEYKGETISFSDITDKWRAGAAQQGKGVYAFDPPEICLVIHPFGALGSMNAGVEPLEELTYDPPDPSWQYIGSTNLFDWSDIDESGVSQIHYVGMSIDGSNYLYKIYGNYGIYRYYFDIYERHIASSIIPILFGGLLLVLPAFSMFFLNFSTLSRREKKWESKTNLSRH